MKILISGSTGFLGTPLVKILENEGHTVFHLVIKPAGLDREILWDASKNFIEKEKIPRDIDAVINLAGENISEGRWTKAKKKRILESRVISTKFLTDVLNELEIAPKVWINPSAAGYYGNRSDFENIESSPAGAAFLSEVCRQWEYETFNNKQNFKRVVVLRFGVILDKSGGALKKMLPVFERGLGGNLGNGRQYFPCIALPDVIGIIVFALKANLSGVYNTSAPDMLTNADFTKKLADALGKNTFFPVPAFVLKLLFGKMADETLLMSTKISPEKIIKAGYKFKYPDIGLFLKENLAKN